VRVWLLLGMATLLAACAQLSALRVVDRAAALPSQGHVEHFRLEGRLSVRAGAESFSGNLVWLRNAREEALLLSTPLGQGVAEIRREGAGMRLTDAEGRIHVAESGDALLRKVLGIDMPLSGLVYWLSAHPRPDASFQASLDADGRLVAMQQDGWQIEYGRHRRAGERWLPGRIFARRGEDLEFRLIIDAWEEAGGK
jgi:outer membrane lipoprotein LolB